MATTADEHQRALIYLNSLELMVEDLPEVASEWDQISDGERESWSHDWDNEMGSLRYLTDCVARGRLDEANVGRYEQVVAKLNAALPILQRLNLRTPEAVRAS
ncbi:MAG: hypothetical protein ACRDJE_16550 [Dehalococcoidia bacterium]